MNAAGKSYWSIPVVEYDHDVRNSGNRSRISIDVVDDVPGMRKLEEEWDNLSRHSSATIFQTFDWQFQWWKHFADKPDLHLFIVLFRAEGRLIGLAPLFIQSHVLLHFKLFSQLKLLGSELEQPGLPHLPLEKEGLGDYLDILVETGYEKEITRAFVSFLEHQTHLWDEINFQNIREDGFIFTYVLPVLSGRDFVIRQRISDVCPKITLSGSWEEFITSAPTSVVQHLQKVQNEYFQDSEYSIEDISKKGNVTGGIQTLAQLHQRRWESAGFPGLFSDRRFEAFQRDVANAFAQKGWLLFKNLRNNGKNVATHLGFLFNDQIYSYMVEYDSEGSVISPDDEVAPATALLLDVMKSATASDYQVLDLGRGYEAYKFRLTNEFTRNWKFIIRPRETNTGNSSSQNRKHRKFWNSFLRMIPKTEYEVSLMKKIAQEKGLKKVFFHYPSSILKRKTSKREKIDHLVHLGIKKNNAVFSTRPIKNEQINKSGGIAESLLTSDVHNGNGNHTGTENATKNSLVTEYITELEAVKKLGDEWNELEADFSNPLISSDWFISAAQAFCPPDVLKMISVKSAGKLTALAPLCIKDNPDKKLQIIGTSVIGEPGGVLYKDRASITELIRAILDLNMPIYLKGLRYFSPEREVLESELKKRKLLSLVREERIPYVAIEGNWEDFRKQMSPSRRSSLRRLQRQAEKKGEVGFEAITPTEENLEKYLDEVYRIEAANWKGKIGTAMKMNPVLGEFFKMHSQKAAKRGRIRIFFLKIGDETVATQLTIFHANRLWINKIGHNEAWSFCSPGILLMDKVVRYCFENGLSGCEFLGSNEPWLHIWANESHGLATYKIFPRSVKGRINLLMDFYHMYSQRIAGIIHKRRIQSSSSSSGSNN